MELAEFRLFEPAENCIVSANDGGIGHRPDRKIHETIFEDELVRLVISLSRQTGNDVTERAVRLDYGDGPGMDRIDLVLEKSDRCERDLIPENTGLG